MSDDLSQLKSLRAANAVQMTQARLQDEIAAKAEALQRYLTGINSVLAEPIEDCLAMDVYGTPCIAAKSPQIGRAHV